MITYVSGVGCVSVNSFEKVKLLLSLDCFRFAFKMALPSAVLAATVKALDQNLKFNFLAGIMPASTMYTTFSFLLGFVLVFHTSQSYQRYIGGMSLVVQMSGSFLNVICLLTSFVQVSKARHDEAQKFLSKCAGLMCLLFVSCLAELEETPTLDEEKKPNSVMKRPYSYDIICVQELDVHTLEQITASTCKVETVSVLFQTLVSENVSNGVISMPPPVATRVYQEFGNGVMKFQEAMKFVWAPYPFPFVAMADLLVLVHWVFTPLMVCNWTQGATSAFGFTFIQTFMIWAVNGIAGELDNPYGDDITDLDSKGLAASFNKKVTSVLMGHVAWSVKKLQVSLDGEDQHAHKDFPDTESIAASIKSSLDIKSGTTCLVEVIASHQSDAMTRLMSGDGIEMGPQNNYLGRKLFSRRAPARQATPTGSMPRSCKPSEQSLPEEPRSVILCDTGLQPQFKEQGIRAVGLELDSLTGCDAKLSEERSEASHVNKSPRTIAEAVLAVDREDSEEGIPNYRRVNLISGSHAWSR